MVYSQNGYKANDASLIGQFTIPGTTVKINLRKGDTSVVLLHYAAWHHEHIEKLTQADTGGYNPRSILGSTVLSNHASGTAEDLRWNKHPRGSHNTYTADQKSRIHTQLKFYEGVLRWGEDYLSAPIDGMHFEINKPPADVTRIAAKIRAAAAPRKVDTMKFSITMPVLKQGDRDDRLDGYNRISRIQAIVGATRDGVWGPDTTAKIAAWCKVDKSKATAMTENLWREILGLS